MVAKVNVNMPDTSPPPCEPISVPKISTVKGKWRCDKRTEEFFWWILGHPLVYAETLIKVSSYIPTFISVMIVRKIMLFFAMGWLGLARFMELQ
jgi:hypothetical protein